MMDHDALVALIEQHRYTLYDEDGLSCECGDIPCGESYAEHLAKLIENSLLWFPGQNPHGSALIIDVDASGSGERLKP